MIIGASRHMIPSQAGVLPGPCTSLPPSLQIYGGLNMALVHSIARTILVREFLLLATALCEKLDAVVYELLMFVIISFDEYTLKS